MMKELIVKTRPKSVFSEDIRTIRTNLDFSLSEYEKKVIMITSSLPTEGKSFISSNLATAISQNGNKVLIIDCDLRRGRLHKIFEVSNTQGLSNLISQYNQEIDIKSFLKQTDINKLYVLPRGVVPPNPSELLSSSRFSSIIENLKQYFDYIILDSAPVNGLPDALILSNCADRVVIVTEYGKTSIDALADTKKALENVSANIAGVVINRIPKSKSKYGYYYYGEKEW